MSRFFNSPLINQIFGEDDPTTKAIKEQAANGQERGVDRPVLGDASNGLFPAPIIYPSPIDGSMGDWSNVKFAYPGIGSKSGFTRPDYTDYEFLNYDETSRLTDPDSKIEERKSIYGKFDDYSSMQFTHLLDYFMDQNGGIGEQRTVDKATSVVDENGNPSSVRISDIYLGSFIRTMDDNEDPTMLGYDINIKFDSSPLFNGTIDSFISQLSDYGNTEVGSRQLILDNFKSQLVKFLKIDSSNIGNSEVPEFLGKNGSKVYYMKNLTGLNGLVESGDGDKIKSFIDYGKEFITLQFNEDVTQNIGYLSSLYKSLSWSRIHGKQIIPENLLRFDVDITITEIRKFNRVIGDKSNTIDVYSDLISKYTYTLYECQFFFPTMPHGDSIDMSATKLVESYDIKFNYKYSTMKFSKFFIEPSVEYRKIEYAIDNKYSDISTISPDSTSNSKVENNTIVSGPNAYDLNFYRSYSPTNEPNMVPSDKTGPVEDLKSQEFSKFDGLKQAAKSLRKNLTNAVIKEVNSQIMTQASLLNRTLNNIRNTFTSNEPLGNVYENTGGSEFANDVNRALGNFVGDSLRSFFTKP